MVKNIPILALLALSVSAGYHPDRIHHVDSVPGASLFRGAAPVENNTFVIDDLRADVQRPMSFTSSL